MKHFVSATGILLAIALTTASVLACECPRTKTIDEELAWSDAVFSGEVKSVNAGPRDTSVTFSADSAWKGSKDKSLTVTTANGRQACGVEFKPGQRYLVYATAKGNSLQTSRCTRTRPIEYASDDIEQLGGEGWSPAVGGLRGRVILLPAYNGGLQYFRVILELENVSNTLGQRSIRFDPDRVDLEILERGIERVAVAQSMYGGLAPVWKETLIPFRGSIKFDISFPRTGLMSRDRPVIDLGPQKVWPLESQTFYTVTPKLTIPRQKGDHPTIDWSGTLEMPTIILRPFPEK